MIDFKPLNLEDKKNYEEYLFAEPNRGCEFSFSNLHLWGRQCATMLYDHIVIFSQFNQRSVYPYPLGSGDKKPVLDALIADAKERGIPCRITSLDCAAKETLERLYPGRFRFHCDEGSFDYVYDINDLADLPGKKYQKKRNHCNRFKSDYPDYTVAPLNDENLPLVKEMIEKWYKDRLEENPNSDYLMEQTALSKALRHYKELEMDGLVLFNGDDLLAFTLGSQLSPNTFDVHFEKARWDVNGAYAIINQEFARYIREKHPHIQFLDREEDLGLEGLRIAKQRYFPHHMVEKCWAHLVEDEYEY